MGLGDWLKRKLNIGSAPEETFATQEHDDTISPSEDKSTIVEAPNAGMDSAMEKQEEAVSQETIKTTGDEMELLREKLAQSKKGGIGHTNSETFTTVLNAASSITELMSQGFTEDPAENQNMAMTVLERYGTLMGACERYLAKGGGRTSSGNARKEIITAMLALAQKDVPGIKLAMDHMPSMSKDEISSMTWKDILSNARVTRIKLKGSMAGLETLGGAASVVKRIHASDTESGGLSGFFKKHENITRETEADIDTLDDREINIILKKSKEQAMIACQLPESERAMVKDIKNYKEIEFDRKYFTKSLLDFAAVWNKYYDATVETHNHFFGNGFLGVKGQRGDKVSVSKRNVATSRLAELLGEGQVIAHSELASVEDAGGQAVEGILMQQAQGQAGAEVIDEHMTAKQKECMEKGIEFNQSMAEIPYDRTTPSLQKSMTTLQVMDWMNGQVDRHSGNYFIQKDSAGRMTGVTGIDNDFAFGQTAGSGNYGTQTVMDGKLTIPHMDKALAMRILELTPETLKLFLGDLIEDSAIDACWGRTKQLQDAIRAELRDPNSKVMIDKDEDWNEQTHRDLVGRSRAADKKFRGNSTYYGEFMNVFSPFDNRYERKRKLYYASKEYDDYMYVRCIDNPGTFRMYLVNEVGMDSKDVDRLYARDLIDPLRFSFEEMPASVQNAFVSFFNSSKDVEAEKEKYKKQAAGAKSE